VAECETKQLSESNLDARIIVMVPDYTKPPYSFFAPPGVVRVSESALKMAREFAADAKRARPDGSFVISFAWGDSRAVRRGIDGPLEELGPGLDLVAYDPPDVPSEVIQTVEGLAFAIQIPSNIYDKSAHRLIDTDERLKSKLTLR